MITIVTANYNSGDGLRELAACLRQQSNTQFEWLVVDNMSTDRSLDSVEATFGRSVVVICERDFGIYDAINKGVMRCKSEYYVVVGSDDRPSRDFVEQYSSAIAQEPDLVCRDVIVDNKVIKSQKGRRWLRGQSAAVSHHSMGVMIRKDLHRKIGYYTARFPLAADQLFILTALKMGAKVLYAPGVAGVYSSEGASAKNMYQVWCEFFQIQMIMGGLFSVQLALLVYRLTKVRLQFMKRGYP